MEGWRGKELGGYRLVVLRAGDAHDARFDATAADGAAATVRLLAPPGPDDRWFAERVARELGRYVGVTGPHLAPLLAVGVDDGRAYLVGPPLHGESLRARLGAPLPLAEVVALLDPLAAALDALHARWLPHGGVRPEALLLTANGPFLCDAGLMSALEGAARRAPGGVSAAPRPDPYRAPENASSTLRDPRADIYALAALAWAALTGQPPAPASTGGDTAAPAGLPPALVAALRRGRARSPYERPERASAFIATLRDAAPGDTMPPSPAPPIPTPPMLAPAAPSASHAPEPRSVPASAAPAPPPMPSPSATTRPEPPPPPRMATPPAAPYPPPVATFADYRYTPASVAAPTDLAPPHVADDPALRAARAHLVTTLGSLAAMRGQLVGTLRAVALARGGVSANRGQATRAQRHRAPRRDVPERRAARYVDNWREVYRRTMLDALLPMLKRSSGWLALVVVAALLALGPGIAALLVLGVALVTLVVWLTTPQRTIICTPEGFTVERGTPFRQPLRHTYRWDAIAATTYGEIDPAGAHMSKITPAPQGHFFVHVGPEIVFDQRDTLPPGDFARLIERFSWMTPQLPHEWIPTPDGRFRKVARDRWQASV